MTKISVVINTLNEEKNLPKAVKSVKPFADEVVVVDMKSDDDTQKIAKKLGCKVYEVEKMGYVEPARNYAIAKTMGEWVFILDADEKVSSKLANKIKKLVKKGDADYYAIPRKNIIFGKWMRYSRWWPDYNIRLFRKGKVIWSEIIHSVPETHGEGKDLAPKEKNAIIHYHYESVDQYLTRLNRYTTYQLATLKENKYVFKWSDLISKPTAEFLSRYFQARGYRDGLHGLVLSLLQAFSELILYIKVWEDGGFVEREIKLEGVIKEMKEKVKDLNYWIADTLLEETGSFVQRVKRKFRLP